MLIFGSYGLKHLKISLVDSVKGVFNRVSSQKCSIVLRHLMIGSHEIYSWFFALKNMTCRCKCVCVCSSWCVFCVCLFVWSLWPFTFTYSSFSVIIFKKTKISKNHLYFSYQRLVWVKKMVSEIIFLETFFPSDLLWDIQIIFDTLQSQKAI